MNPYPDILPLRGIMINAHPDDYQNLPIYPHSELILVDVSTKSFLPKDFPPLSVSIKKRPGRVIYLQEVIKAINTMYGGYRFTMRMIGGAPRLGHHVYGIQRTHGRELAPKNFMSAWPYGIVAKPY